MVSLHNTPLGCYINTVNYLCDALDAELWGRGLPVPESPESSAKLEAGSLHNTLVGRQLEFPSTSRAKSGTESRFSNPCDNHDGIGNPSGRIHDSLSGHHDNEDAISFTGNPDIRVPEGLKSEDGLRAGGALEGEDVGRDASKER
ncbi:hypothetical protein NDU88_001113 [Pleurodeles waltl]|uniref:Uncharacterized protein n=1 Tax=Pleurodeles waltl TaxID=8319 RepID=A0AAV7THD4_PLEWA|nr:hypothetical protein NDU88_001113 [Pleurodeles waltl]